MRLETEKKNIQQIIDDVFDWRATREEKNKNKNLHNQMMSRETTQLLSFTLLFAYKSYQTKGKHFLIKFTYIIAKGRRTLYSTKI